MNSKDQQHVEGSFSRTVLRRIQWLAATTGCVAGVALLGLSWIMSILASLLVFGAVLSSWFPRRARWFILIPALVLSVIILPICIANPVELVRAFLVGPHDFNYSAIALSWLLAPILLICCVTAIAMNFAMLGSAQRESA